MILCKNITLNPPQIVLWGLVYCCPIDENKKIDVLFEDSVHAYRSTDESFRQVKINSVDERYRTEFYSDCTFLKISNSEYIQWLSDQSSGMLRLLLISRHLNEKDLGGASMYQYHGWAVILASTDDNISNERELKMYETTKKYIEDLQPNVDVIDIRAINGQYHLWMTGLWNREPSSKFNPMKIMKNIGILAPGSYGMLYVFNDEHPKHFNEFKVYVLVRGNIEEKDDPFLSPLIPVVADEYEL